VKHFKSNNNSFKKRERERVRAIEMCVCVSSTYDTILASKKANVIKYFFSLLFANEVYWVSPPQLKQLFSYDIPDTNTHNSLSFFRVLIKMCLTKYPPSSAFKLGLFVYYIMQVWYGKFLHQLTLIQHWRFGSTNFLLFNFLTRLIRRDWKIYTLNNKRD